MGGAQLALQARLQGQGAVERQALRLIQRLAGGHQGARGLGGQALGQGGGLSGQRVVVDAAPSPTASATSAPTSRTPPTATGTTTPTTRHDPSQAICGAVSTPGMPTPEGNPELHVARIRSAFRRCYQDELSKQPNLTGSVSFDVSVEANGDVRSVTPGASTMPTTVISCVVTRIKKETFDPASAPWTFKIPLHFQQ